jgi:predicted nucleotidyltransferase
MAGVTIPEQITASVQRYVDSLESIGFSYDSVYIFGSYASGLYRDSSDIDVAIISHDFGQDAFGEQNKLSLLTWNINTKIEPHAISWDEWNNSDSLLIREIKKGGILIG